MRRVGGMALMLVAVSCVACSASTPLSSGEFRLASFRSDTLCAGWGLVGDFRLQGSPDDPLIAWLRTPDGTRQKLAWPEGYRAKFDPQLVVLGKAGEVVAGEGSVPSGACPVGDGAWWAEFGPIR